VVKGRSLAWAVPVLAEAAALGRSVAFAWVIGPEELGRAMMLALTVRLVEMASDVGADRLLVQARDGYCPRLQADLQGALVLRGIAGALLLICASPILAMLFADGPSALSPTRSWPLCRSCEGSPISTIAAPNGC
jgi:O-antigen/teichoic acid export membrane protein